jgi:isoquinoline 1-oxidoreductase subunit beta
MIHHRPQGFDHHSFRPSCLIGSAAFAGGIVLSLSLPLGEGRAGSTKSTTPNAFIRIDGDGKVFLTMPCRGMARCVYASIATLIAEELEVALNQVQLEHAPPKGGFAANETLDAQSIDDPNGTSRALKLLGEAAATARVMLIAAAAKCWGVDVRSCHTHEGQVIHAPTWRKLGYGRLAIDAAYLPIPKQVEPKVTRAESRLDQFGASA